MISPSEDLRSQTVHSDWFRALSKYEQPHLLKAIWQLINTFVPYLALWGLMVFLLRRGVAFWMLLPLIVVAAGLLVRVFIFFHDCGHSSFFASRRANRIVGYISGVLTFTPYTAWRLSHAKHHATSGDLDRRGDGDVWTLTVAEYLAAPLRTRIIYRIYRNPLFLFLVGAPFMFFVLQRFPTKDATPSERKSVLLTNLGILVIMGVAGWTIGLRHYLLIQLPAMGLAASVGMWMFYVQHQYDEAYWARHRSWDAIQAALEGSSYYKLPKVMQWFSGNIGLHHVHHLRPRIPNYNLQKCYDEIPALQAVEPLTFLPSLRFMFLNLWDESSQTLVSFRSLKKRLPQTESSH